MLNGIISKSFSPSWLIILQIWNHYREERTFEPSLIWLNTIELANYKHRPSLSEISAFYSTNWILYIWSNCPYFWHCYVMLRVFYATWNTISIISWQSVLLMENETGLPSENHGPVTNHYQTLTQSCIEYNSSQVGIEVITFH